ncbi:MAG TPA: hypothetical protein VFZ21_18215 [Gemmatimonadaceae bacterium]|nr:hypothetical protein [Gemmatimonadaceae bacterium]
MRSERTSRRIAWFTSLALLGACELEEVSIPRTEPRIALHSVLSATAATQVVLLERTRTGSVFLIAPPFDLTDPVVSDEGIAESGATVRLTTPEGQTLFGIEDNVTRGDGKGAGIYRFTLPGNTLTRGGSYRLSIRTISGTEILAETAVPGGDAAVAAEQRVFDRARDTAVVAWPASPGARSYFVRIETPFGPRSFFTDSTRIRLTGELRNVDVNVLPRVFIPGFPQAVTVSAVDSNYYDWYRTNNDALSGTGLISRVQGGIGLFGSLVRLRFQEFRVVAPQTEPAAGLFRFDGPPEQAATTPYLSLELYVESRAGRSDQADALSGRFERRPTFTQPNDPIDGLLGTVHNGRVQLSFLRNWSATDTVEVFTGEIRGDTISGSYRGFGGFVRFVRQR